MADLAGRARGNADRRLLAVVGLLELEPEVVAEVRAPRRALPARPGAGRAAHEVAEEVVEDVGEGRGEVGLAVTEAGGARPVAVLEGKVAASNMLKGNETRPDYRGVPSVVFTIPELARVGMLESDVGEQGRDARVEFTDTSAWFSNLRIGETCSAVKILIDADTDEILGAHMLGPEYAELINFLGLAIKLGLKAGDLKRMTAAYPTVGSDLGSML